MAEDHYRRALTEDPHNADGLHLLGLAGLHGGKIDQAINFISKAIANEPTVAKYHSNLGAAYLAVGDNEKAEISFAAAIDVDPNFADAIYNLACIKATLGQNEEAISFFQRTITLNPSEADAHYNLGLVLDKDEQFEEAISSFKKAIELLPNYALAYKGLGAVLKKANRVKEAVSAYQHAINLDPEFSEAWRNLGMLSVSLAGGNSNDWSKINDIEPKLNNSAINSRHYTYYRLQLSRFRPHLEHSIFEQAQKALPSLTDESLFIGAPDKVAGLNFELAGKQTALWHCGRSGTGLLHSLIDGHPEISTIPSIYLRGYYNPGVWESLCRDGWQKLPKRFTEEFAVIFDAKNPNPTPGKAGENLRDLGFKEGMTTLGERKDEVLRVDPETFCSEALRIMRGMERIDAGSFFKVVHAAFDRATGEPRSKKSIFYHIHNPDDYAALNFLRYSPSAQVLMTVREPIQNCESWLRRPLAENDYATMVYRIAGILNDFDKVEFQNALSVGLRLEDLKNSPDQTLSALAKWMGVEMDDCLFQMTAQGKKWWGDPTSPIHETGSDSSPFDPASITRSVGAIFSENDQLILKTLFYPIRVKFGYCQENPQQFSQDLQSIRPQLEQLFDFEKDIAAKLQIDPEQLKENSSFLYLRAALIARWEMLNEFGTYPNMLEPLPIG